ncbi:MAG: DUF2812 domain-containing protein [Lawsonibacter sp.]|nr:DUF2812 domain-containing protein [Oscillospiraceae bacterium]
MKQQRDLVTKRAPVSVLDLPGMERWLSDMAARGLFLERQASSSFPFPLTTPVLFRRLRFRRDTPRPGRRYHLCPVKEWDSPPSQELLELYAAQGWQYAADFARDFIRFQIFFTDDPTAPEPFTDTDSLAQALRFPVRGCAYALVFALLSLGTTRLRFAPAGAYGPVYELGLTCIPLLLISACLLYLCAYCTDAATVLIFQRRLSRGLPGPIPAAGRLFRLHRGFRLASLLCSLAAVFSLCFSLWASRSNLPLTQWEPDFPLFSLATVEGRGWVPDETYSERVYPDPLRPNLYDSVTFHFNEVDITRAPMQAAYRIEQSGSGTRGNAAMMIAYHTELTVHSAQGRLERMEQAALSGDGYYSQLPASLPFQSAAVPGAEAFRFRQDGIHWEVLAQKDRRALFLSYNGSRDLSQWFPQIAQMLTQTSEP